MRSVTISRCGARQPFSRCLEELDLTRVSAPDLLANVRKYILCWFLTINLSDKPTHEIEDMSWCFFDRNAAKRLIPILRLDWVVVDCDCGREECFRIVLANGRRTYSDRV